MKVIIVSYYFHEKGKMNFGPYPIIYQLGKDIGEVVAGGTTLKTNFLKSEMIDGIKVHRVFSPNILKIINFSYFPFGIGLYNRFKNFHGILHAQDIDACIGFWLLQEPIKVLTIRSFIRSWLLTIPKFKLTAKQKIRIEFLKKWEKMAVENSDYIISPSEFYKKETIKYFDFPEEKITVIPNGVDEKFFSPRKIKTDKPIVLFAGGLSRRKGYDIVVDTFNRLRKKYRNMEFWILGAKGHLDGIKFFDRVPYCKMPEFYNKASIVIHPSWNENCPKVILEAMSCGKPVVTLNVTGNVELIDNEVDGIYASKENFASEVGRLLDDEDLKEEMGRNARKKVLKKYTYGKMLREYMKFYEEIE